MLRLPSHPANLPQLYDSTASTTEDDAGSGSDVDGDEVRSVAASLLLERRRREEAKGTRRRAKAPRSGASSPVAARSTSTGMALGRTPSQELPARESSRQKMPTIEGRDGLGFVIEGLGGTDYEVAVEEGYGRPAFPRERTYTSSLGSAVSANSSPNASPAFIRTAQRLAVTHEAAISFDDPSRLPPPHAHFLPAQAAENHVRFEQSTKRERRHRERSVDGQVALQPEHIVFPDISSASLSSPESRRASAAASSLSSTHRAPFSTPATSGAPSPRLSSPVPAAPRARSPRLPAGPSTLVGEGMSARSSSPSKLYFPSRPPQPKSPAMSVPSSPAPSNSPSSLVFPSRPQQKTATRTAPSPIMSTASKLHFPSPSPAAAATSTFPARSRQPSGSSVGPFPARVQHRPARSTPHASPASVFPSPAPAHTAGPFPPPPVTSPQARYLARAASTALPPSTTSTPVIPVSPSFVSAISVAEPVFPSLGAQLAEDGIVRAGVASRRVSKAPWEVPAGAHQEADSDDGDELDRMMRAQRRGTSAPGRDRQVAKQREQKRKSIHAELLKPARMPPNLSDLPPLPTSPAQVQDEAFHRLLLEADTVKKSLGEALLSDSLSPRRPSAVHQDPYVDVVVLGDSESDADISLDNGMTPSSSTSSEISLPSFPDVPSHRLNAAYLPPARGFSHRRASASDGDERLETLEEDAIDAHAVASPRPYKPSGLVLSQDFAEEPVSDCATAVAKDVKKSLSLHSDSEKSQFHDAVEELAYAHSQSADSASAKGLQEVPLAPVQVPALELARQQTSQWVLDTLASGDGAGRSLNDIGEEEEEEVEAIRRSRLFGAVPDLPPTPASPSTSASSLPFTPLISSFPPIPQPSSSHSAGSARRRAASGSAAAVPPSPALPQRSASPAPSAGSRSSANSSAAVSYTMPQRRGPTSSGGYVKPKSTLGKKIGSLFSSNGSGSTAGGISSRDIVVSPRATSFSPAFDPFAPTGGPDTRTSISASMGISSSRPTLSSSVNSSLADPHGGGETEHENRLAATPRPPAASGADGLSDLLSRFEREEKERIRGIAHARKAALPAMDAGVPLSA
ncbi:hypothetical protein JCM10213_001652 [Rhodosporidiobolus nylandii]